MPTEFDSTDDDPDELPEGGDLPDIRYVRALAAVFQDFELDELEIEAGARRILLRRADMASAAPVAVAEHRPSTIAVPTAAAAVVAQAPAPEPSDAEYIESPFVGTFYRAPRPDAPDFVAIGARVSKGKVVCIIEAMKLFNELETEYDCEIVEVLVENGQPVEYGAKLFRVRRL